MRVTSFCHFLTRERMKEDHGSPATATVLYLESKGLLLSPSTQTKNIIIVGVKKAAWNITGRLARLNNNITHTHKRLHPTNINPKDRFLDGHKHNIINRTIYTIRLIYIINRKRWCYRDGICKNLSQTTTFGRKPSQCDHYFCHMGALRSNKYKHCRG